MKLNGASVVPFHPLREGKEGQLLLPPSSGIAAYLILIMNRLEIVVQAKFVQETNDEITRCFFFFVFIHYIVNLL